ncbi:cyclase family protein [Nocardia higoensis]|uniref:cyclase family protein n=1 Tax=Nocardia higoensis TaxID=228599 RepID=UPI0002D71D33|nr:cyclase family protein [Nocardia higoensis]
MGEAPYIGDALAGTPTNWGRWGEEDEVGSLNHLGPAEVLRGVACARRGTVFTLARELKAAEGDLVWPTRRGAALTTVRDESSWEGRDAPRFPGDFHTADDRIEMALQGTTHVDALGHVWYDGLLYNGYDARSTIGGLQRASVAPIAARGITGRGVLLDLPRHLGVESLEPGRSFDHEDLDRCAAAQGVELGHRDIVVVRTNYLARFEQDPERFWATFEEPGLRYSPELVSWFHEREIPALVTDTMANETTRHNAAGGVMYLHGALMRNLGVVFVEMADLECLAADCAADGVWDFLFIAAPMRVARAAGAPVNPVAVK